MSKTSSSPDPLAKLILKLPVFRRVKAVKHLFLSRLDCLELQLSHFSENDTVMLQGLIDLTESINGLITEIEILHQHVQAVQEEVSIVSQEIAALRQETKINNQKIGNFYQEANNIDRQEIISSENRVL